MSSADFRKGIVQSKANEQGAMIVAADAAVLGGIAWYMSGSWAVGLVSLVAVGFVVISIAKNQQLSAVVSAVGGVLWGYGAFKLAGAFEASPTNALICAAVVGLLSAGAHMNGFQHYSDASSDELTKS